MVHQEIKKRAREAILKLIEKERDGELVDRALIKNILSIFIEVRYANNAHPSSCLNTPSHVVSVHVKGSMCANTVH